MDLLQETLAYDAENILAADSNLLVAVDNQTVAVVAAEEDLVVETAVVAKTVMVVFDRRVKTVVQ